MSNTTTLTGNLTRDPELRFTTSGRAVANFGLAVNRRYQQNGEWQDSVSFLDVTAWGDLAENIAASTGKGDRVTVTGRLEQNTWETDDGDKRSKVEIVANDVAASMQFATVKVTKTVRDKPDNSPDDSVEEPF